eukprot:7188759-Prymnesium_polylepis.1
MLPTTVDLASQLPLLVALVSLWVAWALARYLRTGKVLAVSASPEEPVRQAPEAQQARPRTSGRGRRGPDEAAEAGAAGDILIELPAGWFNVAPGSAVCKVVKVASGRTFGPFAEKTLVCNREAKQAFDQVCRDGGFTQSWEKQAGPDGFTAMKKIPVILLIKLMLGLPQDAEEAVETLTGAFAICMMPHTRTCMNVIVGRHPAPGPSGQMGFAVDKFSLYYPENAAMDAQHGKHWPLLLGYSFRTAVLNGSLNRGSLYGLQTGTIRAKEGTRFDAADHGLIIDDASAYEDCAYVEMRAGEADQARQQRIEGMVAAMVAAYGKSTLALSYEPEEKAAGMTALESEWALLKKQL